MPPRINEQENFVPFKIAAKFNEEELAIGTAFHYRHKEKYYLVTNWHNVTGREPLTHIPKSKTLGIPNNLSLHLPFRSADDGRLIQMGWREVKFPLYEDAEHTKPTWLEHPVHHDKVDIAAFLITDLRNTAARCANEVSDQNRAPTLRAGMDVFVLGYPRGLFGGGKFPIWKRGSIATEPDIDVEGLPLRYIDTATREGMSGAPVFASASGSWMPEGKTELADMILGTGRRFLGIYSGRVGEDSFLAQLGLVWKEQAIIEVIEGDMTGTSSFSLCPKP